MDSSPWLEIAIELIDNRSSRAPVCSAASSVVLRMSVLTSGIVPMNFACEL